MTAVTITETGAASDASSIFGVPFALFGGTYGLTAHSPSWPGSMTMRKLAGDASTFVTVATFSADGYTSVALPSGIYKIVQPGATGSSLDIVRAPK